MFLVIVFVTIVLLVEVFAEHDDIKQPVDLSNQHLCVVIKSNQIKLLSNYIGSLKRHE